MSIEFTATNEQTEKVKTMSSEELIYNYDGFLKKIIFQFDRDGYHFDDLYQTAVLELLKCKEKFDPSRKVFFCVFIKPYITECIKKELSFIRNPVTVCHVVAKRDSLSYQQIKGHGFDFEGSDTNGIDILTEDIIFKSEIKEETDLRIKNLEEKIKNAKLEEKDRLSLMRIVEKIKQKQFLRAKIKPETLKLFHQVLNQDT